MFISGGSDMIDIFLDIFSMIIKKSKKNEIDLKSESFGLIVNDDDSKRKKILMKFLIVLRKNERLNA